jgi:ribonuclease HII
MSLEKDRAKDIPQAQAVKPRSKSFKKSERISLTPKHDFELVRSLFIEQNKNQLELVSSLSQGPGLTLESFDYILGIDEVGVACLAGPVVSACVGYSLRSNVVSRPVPVMIFDSKNLNENEKLESELWLKDQSDFFYEYGRASVEEIDRLNIFHATGLAMCRALEGVLKQIQKIKMSQDKKIRVAVLIDGNRVPREFPNPRAQMEWSDFEIFVSPVVKGDTKSFAVASASILAKNNRDRFMSELSREQEFSKYGWDTNVGYPTPAHKKVIAAHGRTKWHRLSFNCE